MDIHIQDALQACIAGYYEGDAQTHTKEKDAKNLYRSLSDVFNADKSFMEKVETIDILFDDAPAFVNIREFVFDLLLINFFASDSLKLEEDYLDSPEWEAIENDTIDRGTEFLNLLLYIKECMEDDAEPDLADFLHEFLLVDEDEFQDEYAIYEDVISNQVLVESPYSEIARVAASLKDTSDMKDDFYALVSYFSNTVFDAEEFKEYINNSTNKSYDAAVLTALYGYTSGIEVFPKSFLSCTN